MSRMVCVVLEIGFECHRRGELADLDQGRGGLENAGMQAARRNAPELRKDETLSQASLLTRMAPSSACSASRLWGGVRVASSSYTLLDRRGDWNLGDMAKWIDG